MKGFPFSYIRNGLQNLKLHYKRRIYSMVRKINQLVALGYTDTNSS